MKLLPTTLCLAAFVVAVCGAPTLPTPTGEDNLYVESPLQSGLPAGDNDAKEQEMLDETLREIVEEQAQEEQENEDNIDDIDRVDDVDSNAQDLGDNDGDDGFGVGVGVADMSLGNETFRILNPKSDADLVRELNETLNSGNVSNTSIHDPSHTLLQQSTRERNRMLRLNSIKNQMLNMLGFGNRTPIVNITMKGGKHNAMEMYNKFRNTDLMQRLPGDLYTEKVQSFYPSCKTPNNTDEELWTGTGSMNLLFQPSFPTPQKGTITTILSAKLRLFKYSKHNISMPSIVTEPCSQSEDGMFHPPHVIEPLKDDRKIRVSVYWYTRSLKKNKAKKKLVDSVMIGWNSEEWVELNVRPAVRSWNESGRNFGLVVEVENEDENSLSPYDFFNTMNCSKEASAARPVPSFLGGVALQLAGPAAGSFRQDVFPVMEICTLELPHTPNSNKAPKHHQDVTDGEEVSRHMHRHHHGGLGAHLRIIPTVIPTIRPLEEIVIVPEEVQQEKKNVFESKKQDEDEDEDVDVDVDEEDEEVIQVEDEGGEKEEKEEKEIVWSDDHGNKFEEHVIVQKIVRSREAPLTRQGR